MQLAEALKNLALEIKLSNQLQGINNKMKIFWIILKRQEFGENFTSGSVYLKNENEPEVFFCYSLEDAARPDGIKINGKTCIPELTADICITYSEKFKREMILIYNQPDLSLKHNGVCFRGIRIHGGNTVDDTEGCPLVAFKKIASDKIQGSAEKKLFNIVKNKIENGYSVKFKCQRHDKIKLINF